jgi:excisionase family DNA binding protein
MATTPANDTGRKIAYSMAEACAALTISRPTLYKLIAEGRLRTVMLGGRRVVPAEALEQLLAGDD